MDETYAEVMNVDDSVEDTSLERISSADQFYAVSLDTEEVEIRGLGLVRIQEVMGSQRDAFEKTVARGKKKGDDYTNLRARLIINTVLDGEGKLMFKESDMAKINRISGRILDDLFNAIMKFNGMDQDAEARAAKNSGSDQSD